MLECVEGHLLVGPLFTININTRREWVCATVGNRFGKTRLQSLGVARGLRMPQ